MRRGWRWLLLPLLLVGAFAFAHPASAQDFTFGPGSPTITTDRADYMPGDIVYVTGAGWQSMESVHIYVNDSIGNSWSYESNPDPIADPLGGFVFNFQLPSYFISNYTVTATGDLSGVVTTTFTDLSIGLYDQCSNDQGTGFTSGDTGCRWINGNLQQSNSKYAEGDATVQRLWLTDLVPGSTHTLTLTYGTTKGAKHAYDFLTTWNWSESWITEADRCEGITGCVGMAETKTAIPHDTNVPSAYETGVLLTQQTREFVMRGGSLTGATTPAIVSGDYTGDSETAINVSFTVDPANGAMCTTKSGVTTCSVALWFGAHVARQLDWGLGKGAANVSGSPYHVALSQLDGASIGQRDNQMQAGALPPSGSLLLSKDLTGGPSDYTGPFQINYSCAGTTFVGHFDIAAGGSQLIPGIPIGTVCTVTETLPSPPPDGYTFGTPTFTENGVAGDGVVTIDSATVSMAVATNNTLTRDTGTLKLSKSLSGGPSGYDGPFSIGYDCDDGTAHDGSASVKAGEFATVSGIPTGTQCTVTETLPTPPTGYSFGTPSYDPGQTVTITTKDATVEVATSNSLTRDTGSLTITKTIEGAPSGFEGTFYVDVTCDGDGGTYLNRQIDYPTPGYVTINDIPTGNKCTVTEDTPAGAPTGYTWGSVEITDSPATIAKGTTAEVGVKNVVTGRAKVIKTFQGGDVTQTQANGFTFQLRKGASTVSDGTTLQSLVAYAGNATLDFNEVLVPGSHYQLCEIVMPGWNTTLDGGALFVPNSVIPPSLPNPNVNNMTVCVDFIATAGETTTFAVDNSPPPGGRALTIGFWKNWASCAKSNGQQKPVLDQTLALAEPTGIVVSATSGVYPAFGPTVYLVLHGSTGSPNLSPDCLKAVRLLDKSTINAGKKQASDPAFNLAAQLFAAELNFSAGAGKDGNDVNAVNQAVLLLGKYRFNGITHDRISATDTALMNQYAATLDAYNNNA